MRLTTVDHVGAAREECLHASTEEKEAQLLGIPQMVAANMYHLLFHHEATIWEVCSICGRYCTVDANSLHRKAWGECASDEEGAKLCTRFRRICLEKGVKPTTPAEMTAALANTTCHEVHKCDGKQSYGDYYNKKEGAGQEDGGA